MVVGSPQLSTTLERLAGYELGLERNGLAFEPALVVLGRVAPRRGGRGDAGPARPRRAADRAHQRQQRDDDRRHGGAEGARARACPATSRSSAFDDFEWAEFFSPRLTVIAQPVAELGEQAVSLLLSRLEDPTLEPRTIRLPATFVHRDSCGC